MRNENSIWPDRAQIDFQDAGASGNRSPTRAMEGHMRNENKKEGVVVVELDQFKYTLNNYAQPLTELRDSL